MAFATYPSLRGKTILITGGANGIGAAMVKAFARQSAMVAFLDVDAPAGSSLVQTLAASGLREPCFVECDLADVDAIRRAVAFVEERLGPIRVLVNNAANDERCGLSTVTPALWDRTMQSNLRHQFFVAQAVVPGMSQNGGGSIINFGSIVAAYPPTELSVYATAKAGVIGLTRSLARELGPQAIRVNAIVPGWTLTERQRKRWATPENLETALERQCMKKHIAPDAVARMALFLAADDSDMCTGHPFVVDAGTW
jgi:NAD(P)-dependent dehydrogenase (short-subunit alcohol dehydrogenase family)